MTLYLSTAQGSLTNVTGEYAGGAGLSPVESHAECNFRNPFRSDVKRMPKGNSAEDFGGNAYASLFEEG
jgi:hypothetical protein